MTDNTNRVHPIDVGRDAGEDGGLLGIVTSITRHKAGNAVDVVLSINKAVQRATRVALRGDKREHHQYSEHND